MQFGSKFRVNGCNLKVLSFNSKAVELYFPAVILNCQQHCSHMQSVETDVNFPSSLGEVRGLTYCWLICALGHKAVFLVNCFWLFKHVIYRMKNAFRLSSWSKMGVARSNRLILTWSCSLLSVLPWRRPELVYSMEKVVLLLALLAVCLALIQTKPTPHRRHHRNETHVSIVLCLTL